MLIIAMSISDREKTKENRLSTLREDRLATTVNEENASH
uniref:Two-component sensor histidine kinase n=1 Tax=Ascaris lumbricoides TaxID=6252 RepID=A0A0M3HZ82_ASCLU